MHAWKALVIACLGAISTQAVAYEIDNPVERTLVVTTLVPTFILGGTTALTMYGPSTLKSAKPDALAFIDSDGEIRGAQFEQAVRHYHASYPPPHMTDNQLAQAIATAF